MAEHTIETRILLRYDTLYNWMNSTVILKQGEAAIAAAPFDYTIEGTNNRPDNTPPAVGIKVGDGYHYFSELPWVQGVAGDVYNWAKAQTKPTYNANEIQGLTTLIQQYINDAGGGSGGGSGGEVTVEARAYRLIRGTGEDINKYYLQSKGANDEDWVTDVLNYVDLSELAALLTWIGDAADYWNITGFTVDKVNERLALLNYNDTVDPSQIITAVNQTNGRVSVTRGPINATYINGVLGTEQGGTGMSSVDANMVLVGSNSGLLTTREIESTLTSNNNLATNRAIVTYINNATAGLTGAMHYIGEATVEITNGSNVNPRIQGYNFNQVRPGDVITFGSSEYVWDGSLWNLIGDEGSYAVKGSITDRDISDTADISQSKIYNLIADLDSKVDKEEGKKLSSNDYTNEEKNKLAGIEDNAQCNVIEHVYVNGTEALPTTVNGKPNSLSLRVSALTPEEEEKISGIEPYAQVNAIEHIFLNGAELNISTFNNLKKSVNILINEFTNAEKEKLYNIEEGAQANKIESIFLNDVEWAPNDEKEVRITLDQAALNLNVLEGAIIPDNDTFQEVTQLQKKLVLARIAVTSDVKELAQENDTFVILDCGTSTDVI